jgi:hypothetical protein
MRSKPDVKTGDTFVVDSTCKIPTPKFTRRHQRLQQRLYGQGRVEAGRAGDRDTRGADNTIDAKWVGACKADQKPGDMIIAGRAQRP